MSDFLTVVIQLPDDKESRKMITAALQVGSDFHGGCVTAMSPEIVEDSDQDGDEIDGPDVTDMYGDPMPDTSEDETLSPKRMDDAERRSGQRE